MVQQHREPGEKRKFIGDLGPNSPDKVEVAMQFAEEFATKFLDDAAEKIVKVKDAVDFVVRQQCL